MQHASCSGHTAGNVQIVMVDGGWRHSVAATATALFAWGWNKFGQLGLGRSEDPCVPVKVDALSDSGASLDRVSCGWKHTIAVTTDGCFYATGRGTNGQLGMPVSSDVYATLHLL